MTCLGVVATGPVDKVGLRSLCLWFQINFVKYIMKKVRQFILG